MSEPLDVIIEQTINGLKEELDRFIHNCKAQYTNEESVPMDKSPFHLHKDKFGKPLESLFKESEQGEPKAQLILGGMYLWGSEEFKIKQNDIKALHYLEMAANNKNFIAVRACVYRYLLGRGTSKDFERAFSYAKMASEEGDIFSYPIMYSMHIHGIGTEHNLQKAIDCLKTGAEKGEPILSEILGIHWFFRGYEDDALPYLKVAASNGSKKAKELLDRFHENRQSKFD